MRVKEIDKFNNSNDYECAERLYSPASRLNNDLISPNNYMSSKKTQNFVIAPGLRKGKDGILEKLSPRSKTGRGNIAFLTSEEGQRSPNGNKSQVLISSSYVTQMKHHNQEIDQIVKERLTKDYSLNIDSENSSRVHLKSSYRSPVDLRKSKSAKRGIKTNELKQSNIYTSNGFTLGYQSPRHKDHINSTMVKIEKTYVFKPNVSSLNSISERKTMDIRKASPGHIPITINSAYENRKNLGSYHKNVSKAEPNLKHNKSMMIHESKINDSKSSNCTGHKNLKHQKSVNEYNPKFTKFENFSQKLHNASNAPSECNKSSICQISTIDRDTGNITDNKNIEHITSMKELSDSKHSNRINCYSTKAKKVILDKNSKMIKESILSSLKQENDILYYSDDSSDDKHSAIIDRSKGNQKLIIKNEKMQKQNSYGEQLDKFHSSSANYNTAIKNNKQKVTGRYATNLKQRNIDKSSSSNGFKVEKRVNNNVNRLGSGNRSPKILSVNSNKHSIPKAGHSQTADCLRQTIKKKNEEIALINKTISSYITQISEKEDQAKAFQDLSLKFKQNLEDSSELLKKVNQMNMYFLNFYKDFEFLIKEETRDVISHEDHKYKSLQDQLLVILTFCDSNSDKWNIDNTDIFGEFDNLNKEFRESTQKTAKFLSRKNSIANSKYTVDELSNIASCVSAVDRTHEATSPVSTSLISSGKDGNSFS